MRYIRGTHPCRPFTNFKLAHLFLRYRRHPTIYARGPLLVTLLFFVATFLSILHKQHPQNTHHTSNQPRHITNITIPEYLQRRTRRTSPIPLEQGISLIAACMNRRESLSLSLPSWEAIQQIQQIILVDWSSTPNYESTLITNMTKTGRLSLIRVQNANSWVLTRAYNLASKFTTTNYILKVDCDTYLEASFILRHPPPPPGRYYTALSGSERENNERRLRGVWFGHAHDFRNVGGYDERIVGYGYEDVDLYKRFDEFLEPISLDLDYVRHNTAGDVILQDETTFSKSVSTRLNQVFMKNISPWGDVIAAGSASIYEYCYDDHINILYARIVNTPPAAEERLSGVDVTKLKVGVLHQSLHDDYNIPQDILDSLRMSDLEYLAGYLDNDEPRYIIITALKGTDTLSNLFNLVSALQLGITSGRPVITIWPTPQNTSILPYLLDLEATNARMRKVVKSVTARRHGFSRISHVIPAAGCEEVRRCVKNDKAYREIVDVGFAEFRVFDERDPLPLPIREHSFLRLGNSTKLGGTDTRALAYGCIVFSELVTSKLGYFNSDIGLVADSGLNYSAVRSLRDTRHGGSFGVVGPAARLVRKVLSVHQRFCGTVCGLEEMATEMANVVAVVRAERVIPDVEWFSKEDWEDEFDIPEMMVGDLRKLYNTNS